MFCSFIIPTIGRSTLEVAVRSVLDQDFSQAGYEVIVVNDSGIPLSEQDWFHAAQVRILNTHHAERSNARNAGAAIAKGQYLAFLDDDDWILPGALQQFWQLAQQKPEAIWLYGGIQIVDEQDRVLGEINSGLNGKRFAQFMGGSWAPLQSSMVQTNAFFLAGGFNPFITGTEDEDLTRRFAYQGSFANTPQTVACLFRGQSWNTSTNYLRAPTDTKYSRDLILSKPQAFSKLWATADTSFWRGRTLRVYLSTITWNIKRRSILKAANRILYSLLWLARSLPNIFSSSFWSGVRTEHLPETLHFVMQEYEQKADKI
jgi:glycosyltransferase involved in cell wall biosynthesis